MIKQQKAEEALVSLSLQIHIYLYIVVLSSHLFNFDDCYCQLTQLVTRILIHGILKIIKRNDKKIQ